MESVYRRQRGLLMALESTLMFLFACAALVTASVAGAQETADETAETRVTETRQGPGAARDSGEFAAVTTEERTALVTTEIVKGTSAPAAKPRANDAQQDSAYGDYWIYSVDVDLFSDRDGDGYYYGIDLLFDADTIYASADVYAVAFLSYEGGPWNEYAVSNDFTLFGATATDDYVMVSELLTGYPAGRYDLLLELYEADTGLYVASVGPAESFELADLPLEDADRDQPQVVVTTGGGGATGAFLLTLLAGIAWRRRQAARLS